MSKMNKAVNSLIPPEFFSARFVSFIVLLVLGIYLMTLYPMTKLVTGLTDPFYSPTLLILPLIGLFRLTCYAYRKDYHRHLFSHPVACSIGFRGEYKGRSYTGETRFFRVENLHRWFMYFSVAILPFFYYDIAISIIRYPGYSYVISLGTILLVINTILVTVYTLSCHAIRHLVGGNIDCYSCQHSIRGKIFRGQTRINRHHETYAWLSLSMFFLVDLFIRSVAVWHFLNPVLLHW
ncbi:MAG: hypothetical protein M1616_05080 [Candidatus Thermoplasmatota archaeon]|jgi:hypothetical protein|nr:hypothetical protein [Candidatus Thermoplasmatota archaeon]